MMGDATLDAGIIRIELEDIVVKNVMVLDCMGVARAWCRLESAMSLPYIPRDPLYTWKDIREQESVTRQTSTVHAQCIATCL